MKKSRKSLHDFVSMSQRKANKEHQLPEITVSPLTMKKGKKLWKQGYSICEIADKLNIAASTSEKLFYIEPEWMKEH